MSKTKSLHLAGRQLLEDRLAESLGLDKYAYIIKTAPVTNVAANANFQRTFNAFYKVRKNAGWREQYYTFFERAKKERVGFDDILTYLFLTTGNIEASFSSKMAATLDPEHNPIIDQYVLKNLGISLAGIGKEERLRCAIEAYRQLQEWYAAYLQTDEAKVNIAIFDDMLPSYKWISSMKKIDYLLWSLR